MPMMRLTAENQMDGLVTRRCDCGYHDDGRDAQGRRRICRRSSSPRCNMSVKRAVFHVTGTWRRSLVALFVLVNWQVRVSWQSVLVDIPYERLYIYTIPLYGCMARCFSYIWVLMRYFSVFHKPLSCVLHNTTTSNIIHSQLYIITH